MARSINRLVSLRGNTRKKIRDIRKKTQKNKRTDFRTQNLVTQNPAPTPNLGKATVPYNWLLKLLMIALDNKAVYTIRPTIILTVTCSSHISISVNHSVNMLILTVLIKLTKLQCVSIIK